MGSDAKDAIPNQKPSHQVTLDGFCMDLHEVTARKYKECSTVGKCKRGTPEALIDIATRLGALLARVHATPLRAGEPSPAPAIAAVIGDDLDAFGEDHSAVADRAAAGVLEDFERWSTALEGLGPTLGIPVDPADAPSADLAALYEGIEPKHHAGP